MASSLLHALADSYYGFPHTLSESTVLCVRISLERERKERFFFFPSRTPHTPSTERLEIAAQIAKMREREHTPLCFPHIRTNKVAGWTGGGWGMEKFLAANLAFKFISVYSICLFTAAKYSQDSPQPISFECSLHLFCSRTPSATTCPCTAGSSGCRTKGRASPAGGCSTRTQQRPRGSRRGGGRRRSRPPEGDPEEGPGEVGDPEEEEDKAIWASEEEGRGGGEARRDRRPCSGRRRGERVEKELYE